MPASIDVTGQRFGKLVAIRRDGHIGKQIAWLMACDCGGFIRAITGPLRQGQYKSCGCSRATCGSEPRQTREPRHGTRLYNIWSKMKGRCNRSTDAAYYLYGARGIQVCAEWTDNFIAFRDWAKANGYHPDLSIDRIDCDGNYEPANCRWATALEQSRNRRGTRWHKVRGNTDVDCDKPLAVAG